VVLLYHSCLIFHSAFFFSSNHRVSAKFKIAISPVSAKCSDFQPLSTKYHHLKWLFSTKSLNLYLSIKPARVIFKIKKAGFTNLMPATAPNPSPNPQFLFHHVYVSQNQNGGLYNFYARHLH